MSFPAAQTELETFARRQSTRYTFYLFYTMSTVLVGHIPEIEVGLHYLCIRRILEILWNAFIFL